MIFSQILNHDLGCASYFLADGGQAVVVDPRFDIDAYIQLAAKEGVQIAHVIDTHLHADHVSGRERLAERTGARAHRPAEARQAAGASSNGKHADGAGALTDLVAGATIQVGSLTLQAWATPGHRPEHLAIIVTDRSRGDDPWLVLSGDSLLVGDLARPDLAVESELGAQQLHASLRKLVELGDHVELWPAHVGGSLCGGAGLSGKTGSTIGYERRHNPLLQVERQTFVAELLRELPPKPPNLARIVELNRARAGTTPTAVRELDLDALAKQVKAGALIVDGRPPNAFDAGHIAGAINLPSGRSQGTRAGWVLDPRQALVVLGTDHDHGRQIATALHAVGLWNILGIADAAPEQWRHAGLPVRRADSCDVATLAAKLQRGQVQLIDVRETGEWRSGHVHGSHSLPLHQLAHPEEIPNGNGNGNGNGDSIPVAVACATGGRAAFAASVIRRAGRQNVIRVAGGGIGDLPSHGITLDHGE